MIFFILVVVDVLINYLILLNENFVLLLSIKQYIIQDYINRIIEIQMIKTKLLVLMT